MNIFELLLLALVFLSLLVGAQIVRCCWAGRYRAAFRLIGRSTVCLVLYAILVGVSSWMMPQRELRLGEDLCFDDWCLRIDRFEISEGRCRVLGAMSSRAGRVAQREYGIVVYLVDSNGVRIDATVAASDVRFDVQLAPRETVNFSRTFRLNRGQIPQQIEVTHERGFPIEWLIIGQGPFRKPPRVLLIHDMVRAPRLPPEARISPQ